MLTLYQFPTLWDCYSASPFCAKLEAFLRWQDIPYKLVNLNSTKGAPKGKLPYIEDENGKLGDSSLIIEYLCKKYQLAPDSGLTAEQRAIARSVRYLCEEGLYRVISYMRWIDDAGWQIMKGVITDKAPAPVGAVLAPVIRKYVHLQLYMQGIARHRREEVIATGCGDLKALSEYLGDNPFFFGEHMTTIDLTIFSMAGNLISGPFASPVSEMARSTANLVRHAEHIRNLWSVPSRAKAA